MASTSVVFPWSTWAMMAILRIVWVTGRFFLLLFGQRGHGVGGGRQVGELPRIAATSILPAASGARSPCQAAALRWPGLSKQAAGHLMVSVGRRNEVRGQRRARPEEELFHLLDQKRLRRRSPGL